MANDLLNKTLWFMAIISTMVMTGAYYYDGFLFSDMTSQNGTTLLLLIYLMLSVIYVASGLDIEKEK